MRKLKQTISGQKWIFQDDRAQSKQTQQKKKRKLIIDTGMEIARGSFVLSFEDLAFSVVFPLIISITI